MGLQIRGLERSCFPGRPAGWQGAAAKYLPLAVGVFKIPFIFCVGTVETVKVYGLVACFVVQAGGRVRFKLYSPHIGIVFGPFKRHVVHDGYRQRSVSVANEPPITNITIRTVAGGGGSVYPASVHGDVKPLNTR